MPKSHASKIYRLLCWDAIAKHTIHLTFHCESYCLNLVSTLQEKPYNTFYILLWIIFSQIQLLLSKRNHTIHLTLQCESSFLKCSFYSPRDVTLPYQAALRLIQNNDMRIKIIQLNFLNWNYTIRVCDIKVIHLKSVT